MTISSKGFIGRVDSCGFEGVEGKEGGSVIWVLGGIGTEGEGRECGSMSSVRSGDEGSMNGMVSI